MQLTLKNISDDSIIPKLIEFFNGNQFDCKNGSYSICEDLAILKLDIFKMEEDITNG